MGKGDKKTTKGKIVMGSYGNTRKKKKNKIGVSAPKAEKTVEKEVKKATAKKTTSTKKAAEPKAKKTASEKED